MLNQSQNQALIDVANSLGANVEDLRRLIQFESGFDPKRVAKVPYNLARVKKFGEKPKHAKGLIQFTDETARGLGYQDSLDLITKNPTIEEQLRFPVLRHLSPYRPFPTRQSLYMAVFYPVARYWPATKPFPLAVQMANSPIKSPSDYVAFVDRVASKVIPSAGVGLLVLAASAFFF